MSKTFKHEVLMLLWGIWGVTRTGWVLYLCIAFAIGHGVALAVYSIIEAKKESA